MPDEQPTQSSQGDAKLFSLLAYLLGILGGIIFYVISKDPYVRFHSMQSIFLSIAIAIVYGVLGIISVIVPFMFALYGLAGLGGLAVTIIMMLKAYNGERYKLPVIGDMAEKYAK